MNCDDKEHFSSLNEFINLEHVTKFILRAFQMNMRSLNDQFYQTLESYTADEFLWIGWVSHMIPLSFGFSIQPSVIEK